MRTKEVVIDDQKYLMTFSNSVLSEMEEAGIKLTQIAEEGSISKMLKMITLMINAGADYAELKGLGNYPKITEKYLGLVTDPSSILDLKDAMTEVMSGMQNVKAVPPKNARATQGEEALGS